MAPVDRVRQIESSAPRLLFLSDGGITNNLATQVQTEDLFFQGTPKALPASLVLAANASATMGPRRTWPFTLPGASLAAQLVRCLQVLSSNTVIPRAQAALRTTTMGMHAGLGVPFELTTELHVPPSAYAELLAEYVAVDSDRFRDTAPR